ncbi:MAG: bifunctional diguanylate cyclase/phosphodiesterase [Cyanobacteria bacterium J055]|nr:MAG: bifunctional diguanylate cyclase/phosphodiesterase [Cyanobacteria bacterium J055]
MTQDLYRVTSLLPRITDRIQQNSDDLKALLTSAACEIQGILDVDLVQISRWAADGSREIVAESHGNHGSVLSPSARHLEEIEVLSGEYGRRVSHALATSTERSISSAEEQRSLVLPLSLLDREWGSMRIESQGNRNLSPVIQQLLPMLVDLIAIAIERCELRGTVRQQTRHVRAIGRIGSILRLSDNDPRSLQRVLEETISAVGGIGGRLYLQTEANAERSAQLYVWGEQPTDPQLEANPNWQAWISAGKTCEFFRTKPDDGDRKASAKESRQPNIICGCRNIPFPFIVADFHPGTLPQPLTQVFASTAIRSIATISLDGGERCAGYLSVFRSSTSSPQSAVAPQRSQFSHGSDVPQEEDTLSWSAADLRFVQSASLYVYLGWLSGQVQFALDYQASHDILTRLPNRKQFELQLDRALRRTRRDPSVLAVAILDLNGFKRVNYTLGHAVGDRLLLDVTQRLQAQLPSFSCLARWGDDRFIFLLDRSSIEELTRIVQSVLTAFSHPFCLDDREIYITASLGVAIAPTDGNTAAALLKNAEIALSQAKQSRQNSYQFYASDMKRLALAQLVLETDLRKASVRNEFWLDYQPQIDLTTGQIVGMEALIRWHHPTLGVLHPDRFISLAEETGSISEIGEWVLQTACLQQRSWMQSGILPVRVAVNLSARQLQPDLVSKIAKILHDTRMNPRDLELEITESVAVQNLDLTVGILQDFQAMGVTVALDDFGTGYSCLSAVEQLRLNVIKIDRSLVANAPQNSRVAAIAKTILALGRGLNLLVLAEGVETPEQLEFLKSIHCDLVQGNFFSSALSGDRALEFLRNGSVFMGIEKVKLT